MPASVSSPADVINLSLVRIGYKDRVSSLYEGSAQAIQALDIYAQTRDSVLRNGSWMFAQRIVALELLKTGTAGGYFAGNPWDPATNPPQPWLYEYTYPSDCLKVRSLKRPTGFLFNPDPVPINYSLTNDNNYTPARKTLLCNITDAVLVYTGQVTDPATWEADFVEEIAAALGRRLVAVLMGASSGLGPAQDEAVSMQVAAQNQG